MTVRLGRPGDEPALRALQSHLREPSPSLLAHGLRSGGVLVDEAVPGEVEPGGADNGDSTGTAGTTSHGAIAGTASNAGSVTHAIDDPDAAAPVPVGYLLAVAGDGVHVAELVVRPARRREGRATALLTRLIERADGPVSLLVAADNDPARRLYGTLGFSRTERRPSFYDDGTDALLLVRDRTGEGSGEAGGAGDGQAADDR